MVAPPFVPECDLIVEIFDGLLTVPPGPPGTSLRYDGGPAVPPPAVTDTFGDVKEVGDEAPPEVIL
jgi:hypothetical protein